MLLYILINHVNIFVSGEMCFTASLPRVIIHLNGMFHHKPTSYWDTTMAMETPISPRTLIDGSWGYPTVQLRSARAKRLEVQDVNLHQALVVYPSIYLVIIHSCMKLYIITFLIIYIYI